MTERSSLLYFLLFLKVLLLMAVISSGLLHLAPDEAQYWTWSQSLDWGYYSKPPAVAWQIALTTFFFGNTEFGVRFGPLALSFLLPLVAYHFSKFLKMSEDACFWASLALAFSPLGFFLSIAATTDGGLTFFLFLAVGTLAKGLNDEKGPNYALIGFFVMIGALYKWTAFVFWLYLLIALFFFKPLRKKNLAIGVAISLLALAPTFFWNLTHDFATFKHVYRTLATPSTQMGNFFDFLGAQIALLSPFYFIFMVATFCKRFLSSPPSLILMSSFTLGVIVYFFLSLFKKMQPNWALYLYPPGFLLIAQAMVDLRKARWLTYGTILSLLSILGALAIPLLQKHTTLPLPYKFNPFRQNMGWERLGVLLEKVGYREEEDFLFSDKYQSASLLSFYGPKQKRAYFLNLHCQRKNQFSYWPQMNPLEIGKIGYFVLTENMRKEALAWFQDHYTPLLKTYFKEVEFLGGFPLFEAAKNGVKYAIVFKCIHYNGKLPDECNKY